MSAPTPIKRPINLLGNVWRVKYVTQHEPTTIRALYIVAESEDAAKRKTIEDGVAFKQERNLIATELLAEDVYS